MVSDTLAPLYTVFGLKLGCSGAAACLADFWALEGGDERTDEWMDGRKISPFYRTSSPIGAAAPLQPNFNWNTV